MFPLSAVIELKHRQELDGGDTERLKVWYLFNHGSEGARPGDTRTQPAREPCEVHLVDNRVLHGPAEWLVPFPIVSAWVGYDRTH